MLRRIWSVALAASVAASAGLGFTGCGNKSEDPVLFAPKLVGENGVDLDTRKQLLCRGVNVHLDENFLTPENFRAVFDCANYDGKLDQLGPLLRSAEFTDFLKNMNLIFGAKSTGDLRETLRAWLEPTSDGESRIDGLLPVLSGLIANPAFQDGLPVLHHFLAAGLPVWKELLPQLSYLVYDERFPDTFESLAFLFEGRPGEEVDYSAKAKAWARFVRSRVDGKTVAARTLDLGYRLGEIDLPGTSIQEFLDRMNVGGVFAALYKDTGALRGEVINPKLNADPDEEELRDGLSLTPEQRQERAYRKLFVKTQTGDAPIVQLAGLVAEFQGPHPEFLPSLANWFAGNGDRVASGISEYVIRARVISRLSGLSLESFLTAFAAEKGLAPSTKLAAADYVAFLGEAFGSPSFAAWLKEQTGSINREIFGPRNGALMDDASLAPRLAALYQSRAVAEFGGALSPGAPLALSQLNKRFSNLHRSGERLTVDFRGRVKNVEEHTVDLWWEAANAALGEPVVLRFAVELAQTLFSDLAAQFSANGLTLSEWYFQSPYGNPGTTEAIAGYAFKELDFLAKLKKHEAYLKGEFAEEVFPREEDRRAFRLLVDQVPHIWLYVKSGMARSGNDLNRALSSGDDGYLIKTYVALLTGAQRSGWLRDGARLVEAYHLKFEPEPSPPPSRAIEHRRRIDEGAEALTRLLRGLLEPETERDYQTSTLGRLLVPAASLFSPEHRREGERFLYTGATEILRADYDDLNGFLRELFGAGSAGSLPTRREALRTAAEMLRDPVFPTALGQLTRFFQEDAVKPALEFLRRKIDDGSARELMLFLRRVLGFA